MTHPLTRRMNTGHPYKRRKWFAEADWRKWFAGGWRY